MTDGNNQDYGGGLWRYRARPERVVDGDTIDVAMDLGFGVVLTGGEARLRLYGVDTAEVYGVKKDSEEYALGSRQSDFVRGWVEADGEWPLLVETRKGDERGKYGRWLARVVRRRDGAVLNEDIIEEWPTAESGYDW